MRTERSLVGRALLGFCALGVLSAAVPAVGLVLLAVLGLALLGGLVALVRAWYVTRFEVPEPVRRSPVREAA